MHFLHRAAPVGDDLIGDAEVVRFELVEQVRLAGEAIVLEQVVQRHGAPVLIFAARAGGRDAHGQERSLHPVRIVLESVHREDVRGEAVLVGIRRVVVAEP